MANAYGNTDGTSNSKFRIVCEYTATDQNNGYYQYRYRFYIQVTTGNFHGTNITKSWGGTTSVSGTGKYGYSSYYTKNVAYGSNFTLGSTAYAQYTGSQTYRSQISGSTKIATAPTKTYTVAYNANGGSGAPGKQTKTYGKTLKLSMTKPTRTGYTFQGWGTSSGDTSVNYAAGANYTANAAITLYAIWKANTYTVTFNANGGTGAPSNQTKTYGVNLTLSSTRPTRTDYTFLGWGTSAASTTVAYSPGDIYSTNVAITLYAVWSLAYREPIIEVTSLDRCNSSGTLDDEGTYGKVLFNWSTEYAVNSVEVEYKLPSASNWTSAGTISASGTSGTVEKVFGGSLDPELSYSVNITVSDSNGNSSIIKTLGATNFEIDFLYGGGGIAIGKPASNRGFEIAYDTVFEKNISFTLDTVLSALGNNFLGFNNSVPGVYRPTLLSPIGLENGIWFQGKQTSGYFTNILRMNESNQVELNWTSGGLKGRVMKELWTGTLSSGSLTISELPYYNVFAVDIADAVADTTKNRRVILLRSPTNTLTGVTASNTGSDYRLYLVQLTASGTSLQYSTGVTMISFSSSGSISTVDPTRKIYGVYGLL